MIESALLLISGLPGSGKSTLARGVAEGLGWPCLDKDDFLEALFDARGMGDMAWRRALSREADSHFLEALQAAHAPWLAPGGGIRRERATQARRLRIWRGLDA